MPTRFELAIVACLRNEARYVEEWIAYHTVVGVEHFFLYENNSEDDIRHVLKRYIAHGLVTLIDFPIGGAQVPAYRHALHCFSASTTWLAAIDLDEFIVPKVDSDIPAMLCRLGDVDRVVLPWRNFGFSGHRTRPPGLVIENFVLAEDIPDGGFAAMSIKSIARSSAIKSMSVHTQFVGAGRTVDADGNVPDMVDVRLNRPSFASAQLNHYVTKSEAEFVDKIARGEANRQLPRRVYSVDEEQGFATPDHSIGRFIEPTRQRLREHRALSASPYRYGSQVSMRAPHPDPFMRDVTLSVSNYLHGMRITRNRTKPVENLMVGNQRAFVARAEPRHHGVDMWPLSESPHFDDMVRRLEAKVHWRVEAPITVADPATLGTELPLDGARLHVTFAAQVSCDQPVEIRWTVCADEAEWTVVSALPEPGRYVCVVEANNELAVVTAAAAGVSGRGTVTFEELFVLSYG